MILESGDANPAQPKASSAITSSKQQTSTSVKAPAQKVAKKKPSSVAKKQDQPTLLRKPILHFSPRERTVAANKALAEQFKRLSVCSLFYSFALILLKTALMYHSNQTLPLSAKNIHFKKRVISKRHFP